jgi:1-acyl-sn-glycerol-3-phosphate acyltransferase
MKNRKKRYFIIGLLSIPVGLILAILLNLKFDFIDQNMLKAQFKSAHDEALDELVSNPFFFERSAKDDAMIIANKLNMKVIYDGLQNIPKDGAFVMIVNEYSILDAPFIAYGVNYARGKNDAKVVRIKHYNWDNRSKYTLPVVKYYSDGNNFIDGGIDRVINYLEAGHPIIIVASGKYDFRFFNGPKNYLRFKSGFLRLAKEAQVGIIPAYMKLKVPLSLKLLNSILPEFTENIITNKATKLLRNQTVTIKFGEIIEYNHIIQDDLSSTTGYPQEILDKYAKKVFGLDTPNLENKFYANIVE